MTDSLTTVSLITPDSGYDDGDERKKKKTYRADWIRDVISFICFM